jgi:hypothetical protein
MIEVYATQLNYEDHYSRYLRELTICTASIYI